MTPRWLNHLTNISTPTYIIDENKFEENLEIIQNIKKQTNCKVLLALKGFATYTLFHKADQYLDGATASSIYEARLAVEELRGECHIHSIAMSEEECHQYNELANTITFNSLNQFNLFKKVVQTKKPSLGIRINPLIGKAPVEMYNPCSNSSRLGVPINAFPPTILDSIDGLHFHALCEENVDPLKIILNKIEAHFDDHLKKLSWMNWGGGHLLTDSNYKRKELIELINIWQEKYDIHVTLEPGEAIGRHCGYYIGKVLDIIDNSERTVITDLSITAHMPDVLEFPYRPDILGSGLQNEKKHNYLIGGNTCLAGDVIGPYSFDHEIKIGDSLIFLDMGHYTIVKTSNFNGVKQPSIAIANSDGLIKLISNSCYFNFKERLS
jgi:carboxynorspermidine decarboxylase